MTRYQTLSVLVPMIILVVCILGVMIQPAPAAPIPGAIGVYTPVSDIISRYAPWHFRFQGVPYTPDKIIPGGTTLDVYGTFYEDSTSIVWCYIVPQYDWFVPCGRTATYFQAFYGPISFDPVHENPMAVTHPG